MSDRDTYPWLWDVEMDTDTFRRLLRGDAIVHGRDWAWAMVRLIEYAPWSDIQALLPRERFLSGWSAIAHRVRSATRREGMDYVHARLR